MSSVKQSDIENILKTFIDPYLEQDLISAKAIKSIDVDGASASVKIVLGYPAAGYINELASALTTKLDEVPGLDKISIDIDWDITSHAVQKNLKPLANVKNIIAIASGKGGVGKSTTTVNLALALTAEGARAGILDADIYGPSQPLMMGLSGAPASKDGKTMEPKIAYDVQTISIGYLIDQDTPMIWRGPMATSALQQLFSETNWNDLDYLIVDLPPGTGDIQLTLSQNVPVSGAVIVTTPQDIALLDAQKGLKMFEKVDVPVLGIVENMSLHICSKCGHEEPIFGQGGGVKMAKKYNIDFLGALPLDITIREDVDSGHPTVVADPESQTAQMYREIARKMAAKLSLRTKDFKGMFPQIVIQND